MHKLYLLSISVAVLLLSACSDTTAANTPDTGDSLLKSFTLTVDDIIYHAAIDHTTGQVCIGAIEYTGNISKVGYELAEGATIKPLPEKVLVDWPREQVFTVTKGERTEQYTVLLTAYVSKWPQVDGEIIFFDDFDTINYDVWSHIPAGTAGWQLYMSGSPDQAYVKDGELFLVSEMEEGNLLCGGLKTEGKFAFDNCRIDVCARFIDDFEQAGQAIWLMPDWRKQLYSGWPECGEIDIMEHSYNHDYVQQTLHSYYIDIYNNTPAGRATYAGFNKDGYNIYSVEMTSEEIVLLVNGRETQRYANMHLPNEADVMQWPFSAQYYLILSVSSCDRKVFANESKRNMMAIDWVRATRISK